MSTRSRILLSVTIALSAVVFLGGCSAVKLPGVYRLDVQQGNVITQQMLDQLELGMDRRKVRFVLGTPLLTDTFNQDRWDYLYSFQEGGGERVQRHVSLYFDNDVLVRVDGDVHSGPTPKGVRPRNETVVTVPAERPKSGFLAGLVPGFMSKDRKKRTAPREQTADETTVATATESEPTAPSEDNLPRGMSAEDRAYLEALFGDFGKLDHGDNPAASGPQPLATRETASP